MRRLSHAGESSPYSARPLYFASAAEPLIIETPIERKISRAKTGEMPAIGNVNSAGSASMRTSKLNNGNGKITQPTREWSSSTEDQCDGPEQQKGILESLCSYPKGVFFMLGNEFCERFSFYGMRAILIIYLTTEHHLSENVAKQIYHAFVSLAYFSPVFGSILADNYIGRFHVILWVSLVYVLGHVLLSIGAIPILEATIKTGLDYSGLAVIAIATGGIKPCVSAFAADQFGDHQHRERTQFFSFFYFAINAGSLIAIGITPLLRRVNCFNSEHCFALAFGVPGVLMLVAFILFVAGWRFYKITPASKGNILWKVVKCICYALRLKMGTKMSKKRIQHSSTPPEHWLDYAQPKYDRHLIAGIKSLLAVLVLYTPVIFFWALSDQQGSTWVLQARRMDGRVGWFTILPDQMNTFNPLMILILVPIFEAWIYPFTKKICKVTPLRKMAIGGILTAVAFCIAGVVQININDTMEPRPAPKSAFFYRLGNSSQEFVDDNNKIHIPPLNGKHEVQAENYTFDGGKLTLKMETTPTTSFVVGIFEINGKLQVQNFTYTCEKTEEGKTRFYFLVLNNSSLIGTEAFALNENGQKVASANISNGNFIDIQPGFFSKSANYKIAYGSCDTSDDPNKPTCGEYRDVTAQMGAAFVLDLVNPPSNESLSKFQLVRSNSVSILWQLPQVFVITVGEILFSVTGLEFSYSQAAPSMKSVLQALWLITVFFGNVVDIIILRLEISDPVAELFVYAALMFLVIAIFIVLSMRYQYVDEHFLEIPDTPDRNEAESDEKESQIVKNLPHPHILASED